MCASFFSLYCDILLSQSTGVTTGGGGGDAAECGLVCGSDEPRGQTDTKYNSDFVSVSFSVSDLFCVLSHLGLFVSYSNFVFLLLGALESERSRIQKLLKTKASLRDELTIARQKISELEVRHCCSYFSFPWKHLYVSSPCCRLHVFVDLAPHVCVIVCICVG